MSSELRVCRLSAAFGAKIVLEGHRDVPEAVRDKLYREEQERSGRDKRKESHLNVIGFERVVLFPQWVKLAIGSILTDTSTSHIALDVDDRRSPSTSRKGEKRGKSSVTQRMLGERDAQLEIGFERVVLFPQWVKLAIGSILTDTSTSHIALD
jgi:hypothetical protein